MATRYPSEFRRQAVELVRLGEQPITKIAAGLGVSDQTLRNWIKQIDIDEGRRGGLTTEERAEMVRLRRANRVLEMENEILKRAAAFFARENVLPK
jgi:transposase-like protein